MTAMMGRIASLTVDGLSFGLILFLMGCGLSITLGVMRVVNLAHCGFAMVGGYLAWTMVDAFGLGLLPALCVAVAATMALAVILEATVYRWVYRRNQLGQMLMTIGLAFVMEAVVNAAYGPYLRTLPVPSGLAGNWTAGSVSISLYRLFLVGVSGALALLLWLVLERTSFGARLRAAVNNPRMAGCVGVNVARIMTITFTVGCGLAAVGGVLGTQMLPLEPFYAVKYLILVLIVVAAGGLGSLKGSFAAALIIGLGDTIGRYFLPSAGAFMLYLIAGAILLTRPQGLFGVE